MYCGVDIGSRSIEVVLFDGAQIIETGIADTGHKPSENAERLLERVLASAELTRKEIERTVATGYGRNYFTGADRTLSEILCHAGGVAYLFPDARTVIDIGGQDSKMIVLDKKGKPVDFSMNDRCAAGTGKFIEMISASLEVDISEMFSAVKDHNDSVEISTMCAVFAESEMIGLLQSGTPIPTILKGVFRSVAKRTLGMAGLNGIIPKLVFTGGVAMNRGVVEAIKEETGLEVSVPPDPRITGALGAAIVASR
ncbi:MAG: 2-hydroxyglutaryl-CoA dehydratase [Candidatus Sabulitectum sp.]|nr:2-hydroxyglutaryl-CoA dehydratase [Candidatus Sabulitectum sp.]